MGELLNEAKRPVKMMDNEEYTLVTVKRRNEGVLPRGMFKGKDILVKNYFEIKSGDFLISKRQVVHGANGIVPKSLDGAIVSNEYLASTDNEKISVNFLALLSKRPEMYKLFFLSSYGVDIEKLVFDVEDWKKRTIYVPTIKEQETISNFFHTLDDTITLYKRKLDKLKELKKGYLQQMFPQAGESVPRVRFAGYTGDWEERKLGEVLKVNSGRDYKHLNDGEIPVYGTGGYMLSVDESLSEIDAIGIGRKGTIDKPQLLAAPFWTVDTLFFMTPTPKNDLLFLYALSEIVEWAKMDESTGVPSLSKLNIQNIDVCVPEESEQTAIGKFFRTLDEQVASQQAKLDKLKQLKTAYLQKMFV